MSNWEIQAATRKKKKKRQGRLQRQFERRGEVLEAECFSGLSAAGRRG
jgi:hypothetical protein